MYCEKCGNQIDTSYKFCTKCGHSTIHTGSKNPVASQAPVLSNDKWWHRVLKVSYIFVCVQILWIVPTVWVSNSSSYVGYSLGQYIYEDTYESAFLYSLLAICIFIVVTRLIKITVLYIAMGRKPEWKSEFKKLF